jgi:acyl-coenzyme A thioesterase 9
VNISPLTTNTPEEKRLFKQGEQNYTLKKAASKMALRKQTPNDEESDLIHALWLQQLDYHGTSIPRFVRTPFTDEGLRSQYRLPEA